MLRDIEVHKTAPMMCEDHQNEQHLVSHRWHQEEINRSHIPKHDYSEKPSTSGTVVSWTAHGTSLQLMKRPTLSAVNVVLNQQPALDALRTPATAEAGNGNNRSMLVLHGD